MRAYTLGRATAHLGARKRGVGLGQLPPLRSLLLLLLHAPYIY